MEIAFATNNLFGYGQTVSADYTESWGNQVKQSAPETNRFHRYNPSLRRHQGIDG